MGTVGRFLLRLLGRQVVSVADPQARYMEIYRGQHRSDLYVRDRYVFWALVPLREGVGGLGLVKRYTSNADGHLMPAGDSLATEWDLARFLWLERRWPQ